MYYRLLCFMLLIGVSACDNAKPKNALTKDGRALALKYARGFEVTYYEGYKLVTVPKPYQGATAGFTYLLVEEDTAIPQGITYDQLITTPVKRLICTSTTHIPLLDYLDESNTLVGFPTTDYISSEKTRKHIDAGQVKDLGADNDMNIEAIAALEPDLVMAYTLSGDYGQFNKIQQMGAPVVLNAEYLEDHPLGRSEWIKFAAAFFNKEAVADSVFNTIESKYLSLRTMLSPDSLRPTIMSGVVYGDTWFLPGGENYAARLMADAGGRYLWENDSTSGFLELSFEAVYEKAHDANFWIGVANYSSLEELHNSDIRYADFMAYKKGNVYTYNARKGAKGGSEFLELGYMRPDLILADLIKILHPGQLPGYKLYFHDELQ